MDAQSLVRYSCANTWPGRDAETYFPWTLSFYECLGDGKEYWKAFQRMSPDASFGLVLVFSLASGKKSCMIKPEQPDESGYYRVSCFDDMPGCKSSGKKLMEEGISVFLSGPFQARMLVLEKMKGTIET